MKSTKRKRPPDNDSDFEDVPPRPPSLRLLARRLSLVYVVNEISPEPDHEQERPSVTWRPIKQRLRDAFNQLRALLFIHVKDERVCLRLREFLQFHQRSVSWMALLQSKASLDSSIRVLVQVLNEFTPKSKTEELKRIEIHYVLSAMLARVLHGDVVEYCQPAEIVPETDGVPEREDLHAVVSDYPPWWKESVPARTKEIWLPSSQDKSYFARSIQLEGKSWFTLNNVIERPATNNVNQPPRPIPASSEPTDEKKTVNSILKVRLYPTKTQATLLNKMFGTHRAIYNKLVEVSREDCYKISKKERVAKYRPISQKHSLANYLPEYHLEVPEEVMSSTYRDYEKALKSSKALYFALKEKDKKTSFPEHKFKSKKANSSTIELRARDTTSGVGYVCFFPRYFGFKKGEGIKIKQELPKFEFALRLMRTRDAKFYLCISRSREFKQTTSSRVCAIDPGVRSFITMYDPEGVTLGVNDAHDEIFRRCLTIDREILRKSKETKKRKRYRQNKRIYHMFRRVKAMVADMHQKVSSWLSKNYTEVLLPSFQTSEMTSKQKRISSKCSRAMLTWSHYKFKKMLEYKMKRSGGKMIECKEHYTTKTCSSCGRINCNITHEKVFQCPRYELRMDRDVNAARNIFLMNEQLLTRARVARVPGEAYSEVVRYPLWQYQTSSTKHSLWETSAPLVRHSLAKKGISTLQDFLTSDHQWPTLDVFAATVYCATELPSPQSRNIAFLYSQLTQIFDRLFPRGVDSTLIEAPHTQLRPLWPWRVSTPLKTHWFPRIPSKTLYTSLADTKEPAKTHPFQRHVLINAPSTTQLQDHARYLRKFITPRTLDVTIRVWWRILPVHYFFWRQGDQALRYCVHGCNDIESYHHLFWQCSHSSKLWRPVLQQWQLVLDRPATWNQVLFGLDLSLKHRWQRHSRGVLLAWNITRSIVFSLLWQNRNLCKHQQEEPPDPRAQWHLIDNRLRIHLRHVLHRAIAADDTELRNSLIRIVSILAQSPF